MICPQCKTDNAIKDQQGYFKIIRCLACGFTCWLKHYKNIMKTTKVNDPGPEYLED